MESVDDECVDALVDAGDGAAESGCEAVELIEVRVLPSLSVSVRGLCG